MKQLVKIIILLLSIIFLVSEMVFAQDKGGLTPTTKTVTDAIDIHYTGEWGWHIIHKEAPKRILRETPFKRTDACLKCHVKDEYKIFDPHKQRNEKREIFGEKCLYCHVEKPIDIQPTGQGWHVIHKEAPKRILKEVTLRTTSLCFKCHAKDEKTAIPKEIKLIENFTILCEGCHGKGYSPTHPANANHLLKPSAKILAWMKEAEKLFDIIFPLDYEDKVTCITCHNPHEKGIIPVGMIGAEGGGEKHGFRVPGQACKPCHPDK
ncbi:MAG: hypothetical protein Q8N09_08370 [Thermodesulfovibrionia bacterium]|nr:hypothetical protein [Thermodesulfovibrionia bacterium]